MAFLLCVSGWSGLEQSLSAAIERGIVVKKGTYARVDPRTLEVEAPSGSGVRSLDNQWRPAVDRTVQLYQRASSRLKMELLAVLVRGSVAKGIATDVGGASDLDTFAYFKSDKPVNAERIFRTWMAREGTSLRTSIEQELGLHRRIEIDAFFVDTTQSSEVSKAFAASTQSVVVYGSWRPPLLRVPPISLAVDIMADFSRARDALESDPGIVPWFLKRTLRAGMELCFSEVLFYSRDLVPCYEALVKCYPEKDILFLNALQIACGAPADTKMALSVMREMAYFIEDAFLNEERFPEGESTVKTTVSNARVADDPPLSPASLPSALKALTLMTKFFREQEDQFHVDPLPVVRIKPENFVEECEGVGWRECTSLTRPNVFRGAVKSWKAVRRWGTEYLCEALGSDIEVLVSPSNVFTFCKQAHPWIVSGAFTAPSRKVKLSSSEVLQRFSSKLSTDEVAPLFFENCAERIYVQAEVPRELLRSDAEELRSLTGVTAQPERVWMSTAGAVSTLHYDDADSFLFQIRGRKRLILFPVERLDSLNCYPIGHPLGRRSRINLAADDGDEWSAERARHSEFWEEAHGTALEVVLEPGDALFFPARWAHYTESLTLSVSLTYRILP